MKKLIAPLVVAVALSGCATIKPIAKTVLDVAREACGFYASQTGFSFEDACATEKQLRPFIDAILAAQAAAAAKPTGTCPECAACPTPKEEPKPNPVPPPTAPPVPTSTPIPEKK